MPKVQKKEKGFREAVNNLQKELQNTLNSVKNRLNGFRKNMKHMNFRPSYYGDSYSQEPKKKPFNHKRALGMELQLW